MTVTWKAHMKGMKPFFAWFFSCLLYDITNNGKYLLQTQRSQYSHQVMTLSSIKNILETILTNDCNMEGSHERNGKLLLA